MKMTFNPSVMATLVENNWGWFLNQKVAIENYCESVSDGDSRRSYSCKEELFAMSRPHIITQHHRGTPAALQTGLETVAMGTSGSHDMEKAKEEEPKDRKSRKRKRKRTSDLNTGEAAAMEYHKQVRTKLVQAHTAFLSLGRASGLFQEIPADVVPVGKPFLDWGPGNSLADLCGLARLMEDKRPLAVSQGTPSEESRDIFNRLVLVDSDQPIVKCLLGSRYLLPPRSSFLLSDVTRMEPLVQGGLKYHLIVLDPPWENKSVKRGKKYESLSPWQLFQLPIPSLAAPGCLVVTWVTNRQQHMRFVRESLYPHWSVEPVAEWHWLKVTRAGEPVFPMDSPHKKPYETIMLGRFKDQSEDPMEMSLPRHKVICSVPCVIHSRKPQLDEVLHKYLPPSPICLELFARCLQPNWTSWGNEVIKFQHLDFFNEDKAS
ncbi:METTL4 [Branchiostoma lanceolatum]|uniref:METTL4 protein n=1 Tax=Branchiostoma lanceolatum TaxID=7740 RepID=A0A8J9YW36_BRALA|nr:METTL4 [Branchiostoma lanceolatum]